MKLQGKVAIITGAGRGIGQAIAQAFAREGAELLLAARTLPQVEAAAAGLRAQGGRALGLKVDVSEPLQVQAMVAAAIRSYGRVDILVNNAGIQPPIGPLVSNDPEAWLYTVKVNLYGTFLCCHAVLPHMMQQRSGKIVNLSGGGATSPRPNFTAYGSSKTAVVRLTETLAQEVKEYNIQVNAIAPGQIVTHMVEEVLAAGEAAGKEALESARKAKGSGGASISTAAELAVFLASQDSQGLTGRLLSAAWDPWQGFSGQTDAIMKTDWYTLRRITPGPS